MANCQSSRNFKQATRRSSTFVTLAVCLMVIAVYNTPVLAQQGLKIRLLNTEASSWDQRAMEFGDDALTPPEEDDLRMLSSHPLMAADRSAMKDSLTAPSRPEPLPRSILRDGIPGYTPKSVEAGSSIDDGSSPSLLLDSAISNQEEPMSGAYQEQREFQHNLQGIRKHLLNMEAPEEEAKPSLLGDRNDVSHDADSLPGGPERVWRFAPFRRIFGNRFMRAMRPSHTAFDKLFPWNRTPGRNQGVGQPLVNDSWRWAPFGAGWFVGTISGNTLVTDWTGTKPGFYGGYHINWDFDHYWGFEFRYGVASQPHWDNQLLYEEHDFPSVAMRRRHATLQYGDFSFLYYPWGDAKWRPYFRGGFGWGYVKFTDLNYKIWSTSQLSMPFGIGLKYRYSRRLVIRMELVDNFRFGDSGINLQHNLSFTAGIEVRFGGTHTAYWPYNPGRHYW